MGKEQYYYLSVFIKLPKIYLYLNSCAFARVETVGTVSCVQILLCGTDTQQQQCAKGLSEPTTAIYYVLHTLPHI